MAWKKYVWGLLFLNRLLSASSLPTGLSPEDVGRVVGIVGPASALRLLRAADPYLPWPGVKLGLETMLVPAFEINQLGNKDGSIPDLSPIPRLYLSKGLFFNSEITLVYLPANLINTVSTLGVGLRWTFVDEKEDWLSSAVYFAYTGINAFDSNYSGNDLEFGILASKDYVRLKPFVGMGLLISNGSVLTNGTYVDARAFVIHSFVGMEFELPITLTFQFDIMNLSPAGSLFFGKHF